MAVATIPFIQARDYTRGRSVPIDVLVQTDGIVGPQTWHALETGDGSA